MSRSSWFWIGFSLLLAIALFDVIGNGINLISAESEGVNERFPIDDARLQTPSLSRDWSFEGNVDGWTELALSENMGAVDIRAGESDEDFAIRAWLVLYSTDTARIEEALATAEIALVIEDDIVKPVVTPPLDQFAWADAVEILWEIRLPAHIGVTVANQGGRVVVTGIDAPVSVRNTDGVTELVDLTGPVKVEVEGGVLNTTALSGDVRIDASRTAFSLWTNGARLELRSVETKSIVGRLEGASKLDIAFGERPPVLYNSIQVVGDLDLRVDGSRMNVGWGQQGRLSLEATRGYVDLTPTGGPLTGFAEEIDIEVVEGVLRMNLSSLLRDHRLTIDGTEGRVGTQPPLSNLLLEEGGQYRSVFGDGLYPADIRLRNGSVVVLW